MYTFTAPDPQHNILTRHVCFDARQHLRFEYIPDGPLLRYTYDKLIVSTVID